ncbi:hypothetical protein AVEN_148195-1 [Araneus ventricosus]|uniref:Uncharacterized protein n=1 Tax=Araneus ventricosus TaxID=182803 RepID=A0A4Y2DA57_ARAVE|nr:hypothetical protein AVEN_148195-1 [Araneus ventricosus]
MSPLTLKKSRASKGSVSKVSLDRRRQERMCSGDALATPHFAHTGKTLLPWLKEQLLSKSIHFVKALVNISRRYLPAHSWYRSEGPGAAICCKGDRKDHTALARLSSGHLKTLKFSLGDKKFNICTKCNMIRNIYLTVLPWCMMTCLSDRISCWRCKGERSHGSYLIQIRRIGRKRTLRYGLSNKFTPLCNLREHRINNMVPDSGSNRADSGCRYSVRRHQTEENLLSWIFSKE